MKIIKSIEDIDGLEFGDDYIIDIFPENPEDVTEEMIKERNAICEAVNKNLIEKEDQKVEEK